MVLRKPTPAGGALPYPVTPISPPPTHDMASPLKPQPDAFSSSRPHSSASDTKPFLDAQDRGDGDQANPWAETADDEQRIKRPLPTVLRAGSAPRSTEELQTDKGLPDLPHWGEAGAITPRSSSDSQRSRDFWEDDEDDIAETEALPQDDGSRQSESLQVPDTLKDHSTAHSYPTPSSPGLSTVRRKPVGSSEYSQPSPGARSPSYDFASNNPFRQHASANGSLQQDEPVQDDSQDWAGHSDEPDLLEGKGKGVIRDPPTDGTPIRMSANLSLDDRPFEEYSSSYRPSNINLNSAYRSHEQSADVPPTSTPPHPSAAPPPPPSSDKQADLIPLSPGSLPDQNPWSSETHFQSPYSPDVEHPAFRSQEYGQDSGFYEGQEMGIVSREQMPSQLPAVKETPFPPYHQGQPYDQTGPPLPARPSQQSLVNDQGPPLPIRHAQQSLLDESGPALPARRAQKSLLDEPVESYAPPDHPPPNLAPPKPPRSVFQSVPLNETTLQKLKEQRNETYQIKHFNWFDHNTNSLRMSSMLTQNKNGPCPLLALVNALILGKPDDSESALGNALRAREQVSLGLLIESLMDELTSESRDSALEELPDVDELNRFLLRLHSGMNANPRFVAPERRAPNLMDARNSVLHVPLSINTDRKPGTFEQTQDLILYGAFAIPLVHGWLPQRSDPARTAFARAAPTYEDAQTIQFGEEELEIKLRQGGLTPNEQQLWEDIVSIRRFFSTYPTQLTPYGLNVVSESLFPGAFAIMFRNDHFSTIYKHPETGQLYTLVTDAGYADKDEVIWESLVDVSGQRSEFFSGDFRPVGNVEEIIDSSPQPTGHRNSSSHLHEPQHTAPPISPQEVQEQHDADFAMALQLQEEEQARQDNANSRRRSAQNRISNAGGTPSNIPIRIRPADAGPAVPPRNQRSNPAVNRPTNNSSAADDDAPPLYEEAVKGAPYIPPPGHPQHPASDPSPRASTSGITPVVSASSSAPRPVPQRAQAQAQAPRVPQLQRRMSAYQEAQQYVRPDLARPMTHNATMGLQGQPVGRRVQKDQDKDCLVM
jgi:hypothetical protein